MGALPDRAGAEPATAAHPAPGGVRSGRFVERRKTQRAAARELGNRDFPIPREARFNLMLEGDCPNTKRAQRALCELSPGDVARAKVERSGRSDSASEAPATVEP